MAVWTDEAVAFDDGGAGAELAIVRSDEAEAPVDLVEEQEACASLAIDRGGKPDLAVDFCGAEVEAQPFVDIEDEAAADLEVIEEVTFAADEDAVLFVDPDGADDIADDALEIVVSFGVGIAGEIEDDGGAAVEVDATWVGEVAEFEDAGCWKNDVATRVGVFAFALAFDAALLCFGDLFVDPIALFFCFFGGKWFAVASDDAVDANAFDGYALCVEDGGLLDGALAVEVLLLGVDVVGVVLASGFGGFLVAFDIEEEFVDCGKWLGCGGGCRRRRWIRGLLRVGECAGEAEGEGQPV